MARKSKAKLRSKFEDSIAKRLDELGVDYDYELWSYEYDIPLRKNRSKCGDCGSTNLVQTAWYTPDFFLRRGPIIEAKGRFTAADRRKMEAVIKQYPDETFVLMFMRDNRIHKNSTTKYSDWCEARGIDYSINEIKEEWIGGKKDST